MHNRTYNITVNEAESFADLPDDLKPLVDKANQMAINAYAPYSHYKVGAALLLANGTVVGGNNQENIAYPSGLCAERVAFFAASANYPGVEIVAVAIAAINERSESDGPCTPCGSCRQVMAEYETKQGKPITLVMPGGKGTYIITPDIATLLPLQFKAEGLKRRVNKG